MIKRWTSLRLHTQLALASGILLAITIAITTWFNIKSQQQKLVNITTREAISLAKNISIVSSYLLITNKLDELESVLIQFTAFPIISDAKVISLDGQALTHTRKLNSGEIITIYDLTSVKLPDKETVHTLIDWKIDKLIVWQPIKTSTMIGWVKLDITLNEVVALQKKAIIDNLIGAIIAVFLDILVLLAILYIPAKRFKRVVEFAKAMNEHPGDKMSFSGGSYEIDSLVETLNSSSFELLQQNNKIKQQADNLINLTKEKALVEKESEQQEILDSMLEAVITIDEHGVINTYNQAAEKLFGYSEHDVIGKNVTTLMPSPYAEEHHLYLENYLKGGKPKIIGIGGEVEGKRKNGDVFLMKLAVSELPKKEDGKRYFIGSCQDITEERKQEEKLRRSQKMDALGKLTGGIAHDYNNLLAIILGYANLLKDSLKNNQTLSQYVYEIDHAAERGAKITKKLLGFSQYKTPKTTVVNINTLLEEQRFMLEKTLSARIKLIFKLSEDLWLINFDSGSFEDLIINMAINAMHAIEKNGQLTFETENEHVNAHDTKEINLPIGDYIKLTITDTGKGIDNEIKEKIFDPFFTTKGEFGTGLGLSQIYGFMEQCGGGIIVKSSPGKGACFTLYFPRSNQDLSIEEKPEPEITMRTAGREITILVVDDEEVLVSLSYETLTPQGYRVLKAYDGIQALKVLEEEYVDLMVTDIIMPNMDGYELSAEVQQLYPHIKIQVVTGYSSDNVSDTGNKKLYEKRLDKPYTPKALLNRISELLNE